MDVPQILTFARFSEQNRARCEESFYPIEERSGPEWVSKAAEELGECASLVNRRNDAMNGNHPYNRELMSIEEFRFLLGAEIADVISYLDLLAMRYGIDLEDVVRAKFNRVSEKVGSETRL